MRVQYEAPSPYSFLVANSPYLAAENSDLEEVSYIPISETPLRALIAPKIDLDRFFKLGEVERGWYAGYNPFLTG